MDYSSEILKTLSKIFNSLRACDHHKDIQGWSNLLEDVHDTLRVTLRDVEEFRQYCSEPLPRDHDSAIGTPEDGALLVADDGGLDATLTVSPNNVAGSCQDLPALAPNLVFDHPGAESNLVAMNLSPTSQFFDFPGFYRDTAIPGEISFRAASHQDIDADLNGAGTVVSHETLTETACAHQDRE